MQKIKNNIIWGGFQGKSGSKRSKKTNLEVIEALKVAEPKDIFWQNDLQVVVERIQKERWMKRSYSFAALSIILLAFLIYHFSNFTPSSDIADKSELIAKAENNKPMIEEVKIAEILTPPILESESEIEIKMPVKVILPQKEKTDQFDLKIDQINSVLKYLVERSKQYDEFMVTTSAVAKFQIKPKTPIKDEAPLIIATIKVDKANLRSHPSFEGAVIMTVSKDTRLLVQERKREWNRVISPSGKSAWISSEVALIQGGEL